MNRSRALKLLGKFRQRMLSTVYGREGVREACLALMPNFDYNDWDCFPISEFIDCCPVPLNESPSAPATAGMTQGTFFGE